MNNRYLKSMAAFMIAVLFVLFMPADAHTAEKPKISEFLVTNTIDNVIVYLKVQDCFTEKMEEAILAGIPTTFTFTMELYRKRILFDKKEAYLEIKHTVKYDNVKKTFFVSSDNDGEGEQFKDLARAKLAMSDLSGIPVIPLSKLQRDARYYIQAKAELDKVRLPLHLEQIFFFVKLWNFETDWAIKYFIY